MALLDQKVPWNMVWQQVIFMPCYWRFDIYIAYVMYWAQILAWEGVLPYMILPICHSLSSYHSSFHATQPWYTRKKETFFVKGFCNKVQ